MNFIMLQLTPFHIDYIFYKTNHTRKLYKVKKKKDSCFFFYLKSVAVAAIFAEHLDETLEL